jgi:hypothetical protein
MLIESDQQYMSSVNSAMRGRGRGRNNNCGGYGHGSRSNMSGGRFLGRGRGRDGGNQKKDEIRCQICKKLNHEADACWYRYDDDYQTEERYAAGATSSYGVDTNWYTDT